MRLCLASLALVLAVAGCSGPPDRSRDERATSEEATDSSSPPPPAQSRNVGPPSISPTAAPGVVFNYRYDFSLEAPRIAEVQERHAAACEGLGVNRCRITAMHYRQLDEGREVEAVLEFRLEPVIARRFGRAALEVVQQADGSLVQAQITGTDVGTSIDADTRSIAQLQDDLRRLDAQIASRTVAEPDKDGLRQQAEALRQRIRALQETRGERQLSLATTPMAFAYGSDASYSERPNFRRALDSAGDAFLWGAYALTVAVTLLLPWVLLALLGWLAFRFVRQRRSRVPGEAVPPAATV